MDKISLTNSEDTDEYYYRFTSYSHHSVYIEQFRVVEHTPKGVYVQDSLNSRAERHLVIDSHRKKFAYPTIEGARDNFVARKKRHIVLLNNSIYNAESALKEINLTMEIALANREKMVEEKAKKLEDRVVASAINE